MTKPQEHHELTKQIYNLNTTIDATVRQYLERKAEEIQKKGFENMELLNSAALQITVKEARGILGLTPQEDGKKMCACDCHKNNNLWCVHCDKNHHADTVSVQTTEAPKEEKWCEHIKWAWWIDRYDWEFVWAENHKTKLTDMERREGIGYSSKVTFHFCPICAAPRPKAKERTLTLEERIEKIEGFLNL